MSVTRIVSYASGADLAGSRDFYVDVLGLEVAMQNPVLGLVSPANPTAQFVWFGDDDHWHRWPLPLV